MSRIWTRSEPGSRLWVKFFRSDDYTPRHHISASDVEFDWLRLYKECFYFFLDISKFILLWRKNPCTLVRLRLWFSEYLKESVFLCQGWGFLIVVLVYLASNLTYSFLEHELPFGISSVRDYPVYKIFQETKISYPLTRTRTIQYDVLDMLKCDDISCSCNHYFSYYLIFQIRNAGRYNW